MGRMGIRTARRVAAACTGLALLVGLGPIVATAPAAAAAAAPSTLVVGLGDSFASGEGAGSYNPETDDRLRNNFCHRSPWSWQRQVQIPNAVTEQPRVIQSCSGATAANILSANQGKAPAEPPQITWLDGRSPTHVLLSIGGNDLGFQGLIENCYLFDCIASGKVRATEDAIGAAKLQLRAVLEAVVAEAPQAMVVLAGYPQLVQGLCSGFNEPEAAAVDKLARTVRTAWVEAVMMQRVLGKNVRFVDTIDPFKGHGACSLSPWVNKVSLNPLDNQLVVESMHPNVDGYRAYTHAVNRVLQTDPMRCDSRGCRIRFQDESIFYSTSYGTRLVAGSIRTAYESEGEERGWLGYPKTGERVEPANGRSQEFAGGTYWWRSGVGSYPVKGRILAKYVAIGDVDRIGTPVSKEIAVSGGVYQKFSSGHMYFKIGTPEAFYSKGAILARYRWLGETTGLMGWPTTDEVCGLNWGGEAGCRQLYDGSGSSGSAIVYSSVVGGAFEIVGRVYEEFLRAGGPLGALGYPDGPQREQVEAPDDKYTVQVFSLGASIVVSWKQRTKCTYPPGGGVSCIRF